MSIQVFKFSQPAGDFYVGAMPAADVISIAKNEAREFDVLTLSSGGGVQREPSAKRIKEIAEYCRTPDAAFPTPVILALPADTYSLDESRSTLEFTGKGRFAPVIDGQHRLSGIEQSGEEARFTLPVVFALSPTDEQQALLFTIINSKQTRVPASLIYDLFEITKSRSPQRTAHEIARLLNSDKESPWYRALKMLGKASEPDSNESLTQGTFVKELLQHLSAKPADDFAAARAGKPFVPDKTRVLRQYFIDRDEASIQRILTNLFGALREVWPEEWDDHRGNILRRTTGFMATMRALPSLIRHGQETKDLSKAHFVRIFTEAREALEAAGRSLRSGDFASSSQGINELRAFFENAVKTEAETHQEAKRLG